MTITLSTRDDPLFHASLIYAENIEYMSPRKGRLKEGVSRFFQRPATLDEIGANITKFFIVQYVADDEKSSWGAFIDTKHAFEYDSKPIKHLQATLKAIETKVELENDIRQVPSGGKNEHL